MLQLDLGAWDRQAAEAIFGDHDVAAEISRVVEAESCFFLASSAGMLFGLRLRDGTRVALKAVRPTPGLSSARRVQQAVHAAGFPCPRPLLGPVGIGNGLAFVDEWVDGEQRDVREPGRRRRAARLLAELISLAPPLEGLPRVLESTRLFPEPHHPRFDFEREDGRWIDAAAAAVAPLRDGDGRRVVGHSDWSAKHFGWDGDDLAVVYDWPDSLASDTEEALVGQASAVFPSTWDLPVAPKVATLDESEAFVSEYEEAAGRRLDRSRVAAARIHLLAYCARCELSDLGGAEGDFQRELRAQSCSPIKSSRP